MNNGRGNFGGTATLTGGTFAKPASRGLTMAVVGDSYTMGYTSVPRNETWMYRLSAKLGIETPMNFAIGGTGFGAILTSEPTSNFNGRRAIVAAQTPRIVALVGGRNDSGSIVAQQALIESEIDYYKSIGAWVWCTSTASNGSQAGMRTAMVDACASRNVPFLDYNIDGMAKVDAVHPTNAEQQTWADDMARRLGAYSVMP
jgi:lysophospholipase L1-like esterase